MVSLSCDGGDRQTAPPPTQVATREATAQPEPAAASPLDGAKIVSEEIDDSLIKTQVSSAITILLDTSKEDLDRYLQWLYASTTSRTGFEHHANPNSVWGFVFYEDIGYANCPTAWVTRVKKAAADDKPEFENKVHATDSFEAAVKKSMGAVTVAEGVVTQTFAIDDGFLIDAKSSREEVTESLWSRMFIVAELAFPNFGRIDKLSLHATHKGKRVASLNLTRKAFETVGYCEWIERTGAAQDALVEQLRAGKLSESKHAKLELRAPLNALRELLNKLPAGSFEAQKGFTP
jgi:hypothetical protein